jgi:L-alanine-DL-glutamate epimerase-like enolase superfamily enzyme
MHPLTRRAWFGRAAGAGLAAVTGSGAGASQASGQSVPAPAAPGSPFGERPRYDLHAVSRAPVRIERIECLRHDGNVFVRTVSSDGAEGVCLTNERDYLIPLMQDRIVPFFLGKDARDLESLVDLVYRRHQSNYKLAGLAFWNPVGWLEISLLDMLGRIAGRSIADLLGGVRRRAIPMYISSTQRDITPEAEAERFQRRLAETGARAVKFKVGGRMSRNADETPGRTERIVAHLRKVLGDEVTLYADANGSYDVARGIEVGRLLEAHGVTVFEEPCPFDEYDDTRRVTDALDLVVAGGEQDTSLAVFGSIARHRTLDLLQPDLMYNGGVLRALEVARLAAAHGLVGVAPHNPKTGAGQAHMLQFAACVPNLYGFQEYHVSQPKAEPWCSHAFEVKDGMLAVPDGPGLGVTFDPDMLRRAERFAG